MAWLPAQAADEARERQRLEDLRREIGKLSDTLSGDRDRQAKLREELRKSETEIGRLSRTVRELEERRRVGAAELARLEEERKRADAELAGQRQALERQLVAAYAMGHESHLKIIFNQQDPSRLGRTLQYYEYFNQARIERMESFRVAAEGIAALRAGILEEQEKLEALRAERAQQLAALGEQRETRQRTLARLEHDITSRERRLEALREDERSLTALVDRLRETIRDLPPGFDLPGNASFASLKGKLPWPVQGKIAARFGTSREVERMNWRGTLIDAEEGAEVRSIHSGRVVFADWMRGFGLLVIVDHGGGYMSLYGHNQSLYKAVGDRVRAGEVIATVGSSGGQARSGLYFEIRHKGVPDNPAVWCRAAPNSGSSKG
ncbi:MAG: peptidoglycan DD-metalloendopeptidase family protein [Gammaproteobacteria bacterium]|nr:peptidoglycan DD-metalloendopeptidase family protein [Gammaproteobacteria bacterium]